MIRSPRRILGEYNTYYDGFSPSNSNPPPYLDEDGEVTSFINRKIKTQGQPLAYFPFAYKKRWDAFVLEELSTSGLIEWPDKASIAYSMQGELSGILLGGYGSWRFGRLFREWGGMSSGSSLVLNENAQPFIALEAAWKPFGWFTLSSMTGVLEYEDEYGITVSSKTFQNAFSISMVELNYKNYFHFDIGSTAVWPKRFELGYLFPLIDNYFYQNNVGDFDNLAAFFDIKARYPGIGDVWVSFFIDEANVSEDNFFEKDRSMYAVQLGGKADIPRLPFSSVELRYTKIEPYTYTHTRIFTPWYGDLAMEQAYLNHGVSLGYYLPPNSDELLLRFKVQPKLRTSAYFQYQMIRHGADYGSRAVDGSSFASELDPDGRSTKPVLRKYFLRDGAYQWFHIFKLAFEHSFKKIPLSLFAETGVVFSHFTDIDGTPNSGAAGDYKKIDTAEYPVSAAFIGTIGVRLFPQ
jgi:hypothetical protein